MEQIKASACALMMLAFLTRAAGMLGDGDDGVMFIAGLGAAACMLAMLRGILTS